MSAQLVEAPLIERVRQLFYVDADGLLRWRICINSRAPAGSLAGGRMPPGYRAVRVDGFRIYAHRIVFAMTHGHWPLGQVDHIDGNKLNNTPSNLRDVTAAVNRHNRKTPLRNTTTGFLGVSKTASGRYRACIKNPAAKAGASVHLGLFDSPEQAHAAYVTAKRELHEGNTL